MDKAASNIIDFATARNVLRPAGLTPEPTYTPGDLARAYEEMIGGPSRETSPPTSEEEREMLAAFHSASPGRKLAVVAFIVETARRRHAESGNVPNGPGHDAAMQVRHQPEQRSDAMLRQLASDAAHGAADPSAVAHPDHELLDLCDQIVMLRRQQNEILEEWQDAAVSTQTHHENMKRNQVALRKPMLRAGKLHAKTAAGIYAKAVAVRSAGLTGASLGKSLAEDLLACTALRAVLWPAEKEGSNS